MRLLREIEISKAVFECDADWKMKFDVIFARHEGAIRPLMRSCGVDFGWNNPGGGYEDTVHAYISALDGVAEELKKLPPGCFDYMYANSSRVVSE